MTELVLGLLLFLGVHSLRLVVPDWRIATISRIGEPAWKGLYSLVAIVGLVLIVVGYGQAQADPTALWTPPAWGRHATALLVMLAFILVAAAYVPGTVIRARLGHPMLAGAKLWAFGHLLSNGTLADLLLFGGFLAWSIALFAVLRRHDRGHGVVRPTVGWSRDAIAVVVGLVAGGVFAFVLHGPLIGVRPF